MDSIKRTKTARLVFLLCFLLFSLLLLHDVIKGTQKPTADNAAMLHEMQSAERAHRILSFLRDMKAAVIICCVENLASIEEDPARFRKRVNHDPLAVKNFLGESLNCMQDFPLTFDEAYHFYVLEDGRVLVGFDLTDEDELTLETLDRIAKGSGASLVVLDPGTRNGRRAICMEFNMQLCGDRRTGEAGFKRGFSERLGRTETRDVEDSEDSAFDTSTRFGRCDRRWTKSVKVS